MPRPLAGLLAFALVACNAGGAPAQGDANAPAAGAAPTLIVLVTIDQFRADYLTRFGPQLHGGLARLTRGGAWFTDAHQDHAITETAPGHATLLAGRFPRSTGIMMNSVGVADDASPLIAGGYGPGASPRRFTGTTLVDWLHARDARSRASRSRRRIAARSCPWDARAPRCTGIPLTGDTSRAGTIGIPSPRG
jgi:hypothetical protein